MRLADFVVEVFCPSECVRLIQDQASMRNVDSRIHSLRFDCCVFLFYSFSAVTFATKSAQHASSLRRTTADCVRDAIAHCDGVDQLDLGALDREHTDRLVLAIGDEGQSASRIDAQP